MNPFREVYLAELSAKQKKIDKDKDGEIDSEDLAALRKEEKDEEVCEECGKNPCECDKDEKMEEGYEGKGNHRPGWMLRADPELAKKFKEIQDRHKTMAKWAGKTVPKKDVKEEVELEEGNGAYMAAVAAMPAAAYVGAKLGAKLHDLAVKRAHKQIDASNAKRKATIAAKKVQKEEVEVMSEADEKKHFTNAMNNIPAHRRDAARKAYKHLRSKGQTHAAAMTSMHNTFKEDFDLTEAVIKTTHEDPLVLVKKGDSIHTHANLSVANDIHGTKVSHADVHKGPVKAGGYTFSISKHHAAAMKEETELQEGQTEDWKQIQSMDKGSVTGGKEAVSKHLTYLKAVHAHHKKYGNDTLAVRKKIENINRSHIAKEETTMEFTQEELALVEEFLQIAEKMNLSKATMGDVIKDFKKSDAPQFAGKSDEKRRQMAIAAKLQADRETKKEEVEQPTSFKSFLEGNAFDWKNQKSQTGMRTGEKKSTAQGTVTKTATGVKHERDYDKAEKAGAPEGQEKRGRGRPKGSASGARQKGTAPKDDRYDSTGHRLLLPTRH